MLRTFNNIPKSNISILIIGLIIFSFSISGLCFAQSGLNNKDYKKFIGQWALVSDKEAIRKNGWAPSDYNISMKDGKIEISFTTQFYKGKLITQETMQLYFGNEPIRDLLVITSNDTLLSINLGGEEYNVYKYFRVKK